MKKFLFTLAALFMTSTAFAECALYIDDFEVAQAELGTEICIPVKAHFDARLNAYDVEFTYPEGLVATFVEPGADMSVQSYNARGRATTFTATLYGAVDPYEHFIATIGEMGYWQPEEGGGWEAYGAVKWEAGEYEEMLLLYFEPAADFQGGEIVVKTTCSSGFDNRGGTTKDNGDEGVQFTRVCNVTVEGGVVVPPIFEGEIIIGDPTEDGYVSIEYTGSEDVTIRVMIDGIYVPMTDGMVFLGAYGESEITVEVSAEGYETLTATKVVNWEEPVLEPSEKPVITSEETAEGVVVTATGNGHICLYWDDQLMAEGEGTASWTIPYGDDPEGEEYGISATAQEEGKAVSEYALATIYVPGKTVEPYETPAPEVETNMTDDAFVITVTGEGQVVLHVQYIDNETGDLTEETYEGEGTVTVSIPRGEEDCYINFWATAQANEDAYPGISAVEYYVEIPAKEEVGPEDPHMTGYWLVEYNADGEKVYIELFPGQNGDYVNVDDVTYPEFYEVSSFYFLINGEAYGAAENMTEAFLGDADENPLVPGENTYYVGVGYSYTFGVHFIYDQNTMEFMGYSAYVAKGGPVDVDEVAAGKTVAGVRYYNMAGQEMQEANGMTIVVTTYTDGTTSAAKVIK